MNRRSFLFGWTQRKPLSAIGANAPSNSTSFNNMYIKGDLVIDGTLQINPPGSLNCQFSVGMPIGAIQLSPLNPLYGTFGNNVQETPLELLIGERVDNV